MTPGEIKSVARAMREYGISRIKMDGFEMELGLVPEPLDQRGTKAPSIQVDAPTEVSDPIKHKVEEMMSVMKLSDNELVDRLFPDHTEVENEESA